MSHQRTRAPHPQRAGEGSPRVPRTLWDSQPVALSLVVAFAGLPIFSGGRAGLQVLAGGSAGYVIGFLLAALLVGIAAQLIIRRLPARRRAVWFFLAATVVSLAAVAVPRAFPDVLVRRVE